MAKTEPCQRFASWLWDAMRVAGYPPEPDRRLAGRTRFAAAAGVSVSTVTRALDMARVPEPGVLRKMAPALRRPVVEAFVAAGYLTTSEAGTAAEGMPPGALIADVATAIQHDADLIEEAREHLLTQYQLLLRLSEQETGDAVTSPAAPPDVELQQRLSDLRGDTRRAAAHDRVRPVIDSPSTSTTEEEQGEDATAAASGEDQ